MTPYYHHGGVRIYCADCMDVFAELSPVDLILTDPPYNAVNRRTGGLRVIDKGQADAASIDIPRLAEEFIRLSRGTIYVWCSDEQYTDWVMEFKRRKLTTRNCVWWKTDPCPTNGENLWLSALELCVFARQAGATFNRFCAPPVWRGPSAAENGHSTPKPEWLMRELILASSHAGQTVLDPFAGSGTTLRAAKDLGLQAIGIEIEERWCEMAAKRLSQGVLELQDSPCNPETGVL